MVQAPYPKPFDEDYRLQVLRRLNILDSEPEPEFDRLTMLACRHFGTKFAVISLIDADRQWFKSTCGLDARETPREQAFCAHTIMESEILFVLDATQDKRFNTNPLVVGPPNIRFYAGAPIHVENAAIGTLCIIDDKTRDAFGPDDQESLAAFAKIAEDALAVRIQSHRKTEALAQEAERLAEAGETAKAQFLALMSHELRTPLNAVIGFAECISSELLGPVEPAKYKEFAERIAVGGKRQLRLVNRLLELTSEGRVDVVDEVVDLRALVARCIETLSGETLMAGVTVAVGAPDSTVTLEADRLHLEQILLEVIGNAVKFTPQGGRIYIEYDIDTDDAVVLEIRDTGTGIADEAFADALAVFGRLDAEGDKAIEGLGVGLPIAKKLAELHGAELTLSSPAERGTRVVVRFPSYRTVR